MDGWMDGWMWGEEGEMWLEFESARYLTEGFGAMSVTRLDRWVKIHGVARM